MYFSNEIFNLAAVMSTTALYKSHFHIYKCLFYKDCVARAHWVLPACIIHIGLSYLNYSRVSHNPMLWYDFFTNVLCLGSLVLSVIIGGEIFMEWGVVEGHMILREYSPCKKVPVGLWVISCQNEPSFDFCLPVWSCSLSIISPQGDVVGVKGFRTSTVLCIFESPNLWVK